MKIGRMLATLAVGVLVLIPGPAGSGDPEHGRTLFSAKGCPRCHDPAQATGAAPGLEELRRPQGEFELAGRLWNHVPAMFGSLRSLGVEWPTLSAPEMADLMTFLQADARRDPAPDRTRGQLVLVSKACLKCHSLRGEGGAVKPDLAEARPDYESAAAWAAAMWTHAPRMAAMASERGVPYPRFSGDEMANLVGLLRASSAPHPRH